MRRETKNHQPRLRVVAWCAAMLLTGWSGFTSRERIGTHNSHEANRCRDAQERETARVGVSFAHRFECSRPEMLEARQENHAPATRNPHWRTSFQQAATDPANKSHLARQILIHLIIINCYSQLTCSRSERKWSVPSVRAIRFTGSKGKASSVLNWLLSSVIFLGNVPPATRCKCLRRGEASAGVPIAKKTPSKDLSAKQSIHRSAAQSVSPKH